MRELPLRFIGPLLAIVCTLSSLVCGQNPVPFVNQPLVPLTVAPGSGAFTLTVNGTGFVASSVVNWNGSLLATTFVSNTQLTAQAGARVRRKGHIK